MFVYGFTITENIDCGKRSFCGLNPSSKANGIAPTLFQSKFGNVFMYQHSMKAPDEMRTLHEQFYGCIEKLNT